MADTTPPPAAAPQPVALVIGAGDATGGAIAQRFAREGYVACVTRRSADKPGSRSSASMLSIVFCARLAVTW